MKIKIIDLLNKIANGEEVPKEILLNGIVFEYTGDDYLYKDEDKNEHWLFSVSYIDKYIWLENFLKAEVEIIDEPKKIEKIEMCTGGIMGFDGVENITTELKNKINELIDAVNELKRDK